MITEENIHESCIQLIADNPDCEHNKTPDSDFTLVTTDSVCTDQRLLLSDREGHGHKAVLYKSHFPPLRDSFSQRHHCIHRLINHVYTKGQARSYSLPHDMVAARIKH